MAPPVEQESVKQLAGIAKANDVEGMGGQETLEERLVKEKRRRG